MNRRRFLQLGGISAAGLVLDPELALWVPGKKTFFLMPPKRVVGVTIAQLMAATYDKVLQERDKPGQWFWNDESLIRELAKAEYARLARG